MEFLSGYLLGLMVGILIAIAHIDPVTQSTIEQAQAACSDNKGLLEIDMGNFKCANGAVFEEGKK